VTAGFVTRNAGIGPTELTHSVDVIFLIELTTRPTWVVC